MKKFYLNNDQKILGQSTDQKDFYLLRCTEFKKEPIGFNKIVFLGDSITEAGDWNTYFNTKKTVNRGISGDTTEGVLVRLEEIYYYRPLAVLLLIGINDIFNTAYPERDDIVPENVAKNILLIANTISKNSRSTKLYIQTVLPVNHQIYTKTNGTFPVHSIPLSTKIKEINSLIKDMCNKNDLLQTMDLHSIFKNGTGQLKKAYSEDGVHLNEKGYATWVEKIKIDVPLLNHLIK